MLLGDPTYRILLLSQLSPTAGYGVFKQIVDVSRPRNARLGLSGALVFDGELFCHLLEGTPDEVQALVRTIDADRRHTPLSILYSGLGNGPRRLSSWKSGYCDNDELGIFQGPHGLRGDAALAAFLALLARCDLAD